LLIATTLFALNSIGLISGWLAPPPGYSPMFLHRWQDFAQYLTWSRAFATQDLIPDYHAPWYTEPSYFNLLFWLIGKLSWLLAVDGLVIYHAVRYLLFVAATYVLFLLLQTFLDTPRQRLAACLVIVCNVPVYTLVAFPLVALRTGRDPPAILDLIYNSLDGFLHGPLGSVTALVGTTSVLLVVLCLGQYVATNVKVYLAGACVTVCVSALLHPFEVFVMVPAGSMTLLLLGWRQWRKTFAEVAALALSGLLGLSPWIIQALRSSWIRDAAELNRWHPGALPQLLLLLGVPTILTLLLMLLHPRPSSRRGLLLQVWFASVLVGIYIPRLPFAHHLINGFYYVTALLFVHKASESQLLRRFCVSHRFHPMFALLVWSLVSLGAYVVAYREVFRDSRAVQGARVPPTVASNDEVAAISWMREHARPDDLILAPPANAPWFAAVPMHSFASHHLFSLTYQQQRQLADAFYSGLLGCSAAQQLLEAYGMRFVLVPRDSPAVRYTADMAARAVFGSFVLYELDDHVMAPYPGLELARTTAPPQALREAGIATETVDADTAAPNEEAACPRFGAGG
jgi:hypothetical protein